jgi:hypothetical protein
MGGGDEWRKERLPFLAIGKMQSFSFSSPIFAYSGRLLGQGHTNIQTKFLLFP